MTHITLIADINNELPDMSTLLRTYLASLARGQAQLFDAYTPYSTRTLTA